MATQPAPWRSGDAHRQPPGAGLLEVVADLPLVTDEVAVDVAQMVEVERLETLHGAQRADPEVDGAVAGGEHPSVARDRGAVGGLHGQRRLEQAVGVAGALDVGADRQTERLVGHPIGSEQTGDRAGCTRGDHHEVGIPAFAGDLDARDAAVVVEHRHGGGVVDDLGAGGVRGLDEVGVELAARPHGAVGRKAAGAGPGQLAADLAGDHPQSVDAVRIVEVDLEILERGDRPGCEAVAADLVAPGPAFSNTVTQAPPRAARMAAAAPAGPPPITITSRRCMTPMVPDRRARTGSPAHGRVTPETSRPRGTVGRCPGCRSASRFDRSRPRAGGRSGGCVGASLPPAADTAGDVPQEPLARPQWCGGFRRVPAGDEPAPETTGTRAPWLRSRAARGGRDGRWRSVARSAGERWSRGARRRRTR